MRSRLHPTLPLLAGALLACKSSAPAPDPEPAPAETKTEATEEPEPSGTAHVPATAAEATVAASPAPARVVPASFSPQQGGLQDAAQDIAVREQKQKYLSDQYIARGDELVERADLNGALEQYANALEVMPSSEEARARVRRVRALMGDSYQSAAESFEDAADRVRVRRAQALLAAQEARNSAERALADGDYDEAVRGFQQAEVILRYNPLIATDDLDERVIRQRMQTALELREATMREAERAAAEEARAEQVRLEEEEREYRAQKLHTLYERAHESFVSGKYGMAEDTAELILLLDPGNESATELRDIAQAARHKAVDRENHRRLREEWIKTFEDLETLSVPQSDAIEFDLRRWRDVAARTPIEFSKRDPQISAGRQDILDRLDEVRIKATFGVDGEGAPLEEVASFLQQVTGINFLISAKVRDELDEDTTAQELDLPQRSVRKILDIVAETTDGLNWKVEDGVVKFVTDEEMQGGQVLRMYEVRDLIHPVPDFPGREINISPSGGLEPPDEDIEEREALVVTPEYLDDLIRSNVSPESWDEDPANSLRVTESGTLVVNQTPEVHDHIARLLDDLREATGIMVNIQSRFLQVEDNFLEDISIDFRGLGPPGLGDANRFNDFGDQTTQQDLGSEIGSDTSVGAFYDSGDNGDYRARIENLWDADLGDDNVLTGAGGLSFQWTYINDLQLEMILRAVTKSSRVELVTAPNILVFNTARANLTVMNQVAYVQDYDVEIAQGASIADPIIDVIQDGVILDVRPVVSADRRFITLELRPTVAELQRPIEEVATSLGTQNTVTIQLPEVEISRVRTSVPMPDGGTVLLGGLKIHESRLQDSGVPILNQIPIVKFFFQRKGNYNANQKLLILLKANIVIPAEHEPSPERVNAGRR